MHHSATSIDTQGSSTEVSLSNSAGSSATVEALPSPPATTTTTTVGEPTATTAVENAPAANVPEIATTAAGAAVQTLQPELQQQQQQQQQQQPQQQTNTEEILLTPISMPGKAESITPTSQPPHNHQESPLSSNVPTSLTTTGSYSNSSGSNQRSNFDLSTAPNQPSHAQAPGSQRQPPIQIDKGRYGQGSRSYGSTASTMGSSYLYSVGRSASSLGSDRGRHYGDVKTSGQSFASRNISRAASVTAHYPDLIYEDPRVGAYYYTKGTHRELDTMRQLVQQFDVKRGTASHETRDESKSKALSAILDPGSPYHRNMLASNRQLYAALAETDHPLLASMSRCIQVEMMGSSGGVASGNQQQQPSVTDDEFWQSLMPPTSSVSSSTQAKPTAAGNEYLAASSGERLRERLDRISRIREVTDEPEDSPYGQPGFQSHWSVLRRYLDELERLEPAEAAATTSLEGGIDTDYEQSQQTIIDGTHAAADAWRGRGKQGFSLLLSRMESEFVSESSQQGAVRSEPDRTRHRDGDVDSDSTSEDEKDGLDYNTREMKRLIDLQLYPPRYSRLLLEKQQRTPQRQPPHQPQAQPPLSPSPLQQQQQQHLNHLELMEQSKRPRSYDRWGKGGDSASINSNIVGYDEDSRYHHTSHPTQLQLSGRGHSHGGSVR
ncbi:hypothetical protein EV182_003391, partial [Spiromyces aspiralis]